MTGIIIGLAISAFSGDYVIVKRSKYEELKQRVK